MSYVGNVGLLSLASLTIYFGVKRAESFDSGKEKPIIFSRENIQQINIFWACLFPVIASISLLVLYLFVGDILKYIFLGSVFIFSFVSLYILFFPITSCLSPGRSVKQLRTLNIILVIIKILYWMYSIHYSPSLFWVFNNIIAVSIVLVYFYILRISNLKVSVILLSGLFLYDLFWVFGSERIFEENVMVKVAEVMIFRNYVPATLMFPRSYDSLLRIFEYNSRPGRDDFSLLGLGDVLVPGLFILTSSKCDDILNFGRKYYFYITLFSYIVSLELTILISMYFQHAQPALIYIVPFLLGSFFISSFFNGDLGTLWNTPLSLNDLGLGDEQQEQQQEEEEKDVYIAPASDGVEETESIPSPVVSSASSTPITERKKETVLPN